MGKHAFDFFLSELIIRGIQPKYAIEIAKYFEPDCFEYNQDISTMSFIDVNCGTNFPENWEKIKNSLYPYEDDINDVCLECYKENLHLFDHCQYCEKECDYCETNPCKKCSHHAAKENKKKIIDESIVYEHLETMDYIKKNRLAKHTKIYVDNSNMFRGSTDWFKKAYSISSKDKSEYGKLYDGWFMLTPIRCIRPGEDILLEMPTLFMASTEVSDLRARWLKSLTKTCGYIHKNLHSKYLKQDVGKGKRNTEEDKMMRDAIRTDLFNKSVDHFIICTGDGNKKDGDTFVKVVKDLLRAKRDVTICAFSDSIHRDYKKLAVNYNNINIFHPDLDFLAKTSITNMMIYGKINP
jgi:hypothetical protein